RRNPGRDDGEHRPDGNASPPAFAGRLRPVDGEAQRDEKVGGPPRKGLPRGGRRDALGMALQQRNAELALELVDLPGKGGLSEVGTRRGTGEAPCLGDGDEVSEIPQEHRTPWPCADGIEALADRYFLPTCLPH